MTDEIAPLQSSDDLACIAQWIFDEWGALDPDETLETCLADLCRSFDEELPVPKTFVYRQGGRMAGWASIIEVDLKDRPELGPWLANLVVLPEFRGQGIARKLTRHVMDYAQGVTDHLYLYTDNLQASYAKQGWQTVREIHIGAKPVTLMEWPTGG